MKKMLFFVIALAVLCGNTAATDLSLDEAISVMADKIMASPKLGKGQWKKIVLMDFSDSIETQNYIEEELTNKLVNGFTVIDRKNLGILREELEFQRSGKVDVDAIRRIGFVSGTDFVLWGTLRNGEFEVQAHNVQDGLTDFKGDLRVNKYDNVLTRLERNTPLSHWLSSLPNLQIGVEVAVSHLTKKILESKYGLHKVLIYDIMADKKELSESVSGKIETILANDTRIKLITGRERLLWIEEEMKFQASGEVDVNTAKKPGKLRGADAVIYGNIRPLGSNYRLFLCAVDVESGKFIATHSQKIRGDKKEIRDIASPKKVSDVKVEALTSNKIRISWKNALDARNFIVTRSAGQRRHYTGASTVFDFRLEPETECCYNAESSGAEQRRFYTGANVWIDFDLKPETEYCYTVQPRNTAGLGDTSGTVCDTTHGKPKVSDHKVTAKAETKKSVTLSWSKVHGASHYSIQRCREQSQSCDTIARIVRDSFYKDTSGLQSSTRYTYQIEAINSAGADRLRSTTVITKPLPPVQVKAGKSFADKVELKWEDTQKNIDYYVVDVSPKVGDKYPVKTANNNVSAMVPNLKPETKYQFRVKAVNTSGDGSAFSEPIEATTSGKPNAPEGVSIRIDSSSHSYVGRQRSASYSRNFLDDNDDYNGESSYDRSKVVEITWRPTAGAEKYFIYKNEKQLPPVTDTKYREDYSALEKGVEHVYFISSYNSAGESAQSRASIFTEPKPPVIIKHDIQDNWFSIEWERAPGVLRYYVRDIITDKARGNNILTPISGTSFKKEGLQYASMFKYCVIAENSVGRSACSDTITIETPIPPPTITKTAEYGLDSVRIWWQRSDGAVYYKIYRAEEGERGSKEIGRTRSASGYNDYYYGTSGKSDPKTEWADENIEPKKEYYYYVAAVDKNGKESMSKAYKHKTSAAGTLVLKNENDSNDIITSYKIKYKIKSGSETVAEHASLHIKPGENTSIVLPAGAKNYEIQITTTTNGYAPIGGDKSFEISENKETTFIYKKSLRLW
jgi:fibronectin type 3 domain-containing protein